MSGQTIDTSEIVVPFARVARNGVSDDGDLLDSAGRTFWGCSTGLPAWRKKTANTRWALLTSSRFSFAPPRTGSRISRRMSATTRIGPIARRNGSIKSPKRSTNDFSSRLTVDPPRRRLDKSARKPTQGRLKAGEPHRRCADGRRLVRQKSYFNCVWGALLFPDTSKIPRRNRSSEDTRYPGPR
jgi:hypothetical protein